MHNFKENGQTLPNQIYKIPNISPNLVEGVLKDQPVTQIKTGTLKTRFQLPEKLNSLQE